MITFKHVHYEIHDKVSNNDKVNYRFIKFSITSEKYFVYIEVLFIQGFQEY